MRSGTSFFNGTVFRKTFFRFWPIWAANLVVWLLVLPLPLFFSAQNCDKITLLATYQNLMSGVGTMLLLVGAISLATMAAMAVCSHLYSSRSAHFFGSLPVRREGLFLSTYLAGLTMLIMPNLVIFGLTALVETLGAGVVWQPLLFMLAVTCLEEFFFYSMAVLCGMFAGHILALPVFFCVSNVFVVTGNVIMQNILSKFYYGYRANSSGVWESLVRWLTPAWGFSELCCEPTIAGEFAYENVTALIVYGIAAVVMVVAALVLYRRRRLELAGDVVAVRCMRPVFRWITGLCFGVLNGYITAVLLDLESVGTIVSIVIWTVVGSFLAQMLLDKRFRVFAKWKTCLAPAAALLIVFAVIGFDLTGYETRVPEPDRVESVTVSGLSCYPYDGGMQSVQITDSANIELVTTLHKRAVEQRQSGSSNGITVWLELDYCLTNGGTMSRMYSIRMNPSQVQTQGTAAYCVQKLLDDPAFIRQSYGFDELQNMLDAGGVLECCFCYRGNSEWEDEIYAGTDALALWEAVEQDLSAGTIGRHAILSDGSDYSTTLEFSVYLLHGSEIKPTREESVYIFVPETATNTLAVLNRLANQA